MTGRFDARKLLTIGLVVGGGTLLWLSQLNLQAGYWDIFWPQFVQGAGMSLLFVPLTTVAMDPIPRERMGNATSLFNLMRNIGGSIGIATTGTMLARNQQQATAIDARRERDGRTIPTSQTMFAQMRAAFMAAGADAVTATKRAYAALFGMVQRQAAMVSFVGLFQTARHRVPRCWSARAADEAAAAAKRGAGRRRTDQNRKPQRQREHGGIIPERPPCRFGQLSRSHSTAKPLPYRRRGC